MAVPQVLKWDTYCNQTTVVIERPRELHFLLFIFSYQELECTCILTLPTELFKHDQTLLMDEQLPEYSPGPSMIYHLIKIILSQAGRRSCSVKWWNGSYFSARGR